VEELVYEHDAAEQGLAETLGLAEQAGPQASEVREHLAALAEDLAEHSRKEEEDLFPAAIALEQGRGAS
jgi:hypothetical protein